MESERYLRHSMIDWFNQDALMRSSIVVVGAGAVGNEVLKCLSLLGIGQIHVIDFDKIELNNLTRTVLFNESHVGRNKAEVAAEVCRSINPDTKTTYSTADFWDSLSIHRLCSQTALFSCVDNFEARIKLNKLCRIAKVDFYNAGIDSRSVIVESYPFSSNSAVACYECNLPPSVYKTMGERYSCGWLRKKGLIEKKVPTTIITSSIAGAHISSLYLQKENVDAIKDSVRYFIDTIRPASTFSILAANAECHICSKLNGRHQYFRVRNCVPAILSRIHLSEDLVVHFSDKLILEVKCTKCSTSIVVNDRADRYDESLTVCKTCNLRSNYVRFEDCMSLGEIIRHFAHGPIPTKFLSFNVGEQHFILELEVEDERTDTDGPYS